MVLGYNWLTQHNLSIEWVETKITFHNPETQKTPEELPNPAPEAIDICLVSFRIRIPLIYIVLSTTYVYATSCHHQSNISATITYKADYAAAPTTHGFKEKQQQPFKV